MSLIFLSFCLLVTVGKDLDHPNDRSPWEKNINVGRWIPTAHTKSFLFMFRSDNEFIKNTLSQKNIERTSTSLVLNNVKEEMRVII